MKYACLGGTVLATGVLAGVSMFVALFTIGEGRWTESWQARAVLALAALAYGMMILNLDRFIVSSTGKGDGTDRMTWPEIRNAIPRIAMALLLSLMISKPLEVLAFKPELDYWVAEAQKLEEPKIEAKTIARWAADTVALSQQLLQLGRDRQTMDSLRRVYRDLEVREANGTGPTRVGGCRRDCLHWKAKGDSADAAMSGLDSIARTIQDSVGIIRRTARDSAKAAIESYHRSGTLLRRITLIHEHEPRVSLMFTLFLAMLECAPIFFKMMVVRGPYEYLEENQKALRRAERGIEVQGTGHEERIISHDAAHQLREVQMRRLAQEQVQQRALDRWRDRRFRDIDEDPDSFVSPTRPRPDPGNPPPAGGPDA